MVAMSVYACADVCSFKTDSFGLPETKTCVCVYMCVQIIFY